MKYIEITQWKELQHYKDRKPPWIKLYNDLPRKHQYSCLQDDSKLVLISLFLLASCNENKIPFDLLWIQKETSLLKKIKMSSIQELITHGWIKTYVIDASGVAKCLQDACLETETETDKETDKETETHTQREKKKPVFVPPAFEEIEAYINEKEYRVDPKVFFDYFDPDWIDSKGNAVKNWKQKIITWSSMGNGRKTTKTGNGKQNPSAGSSTNGGDFETTSAIGRTVKV